MLCKQTKADLYANAKHACTLDCLLASNLSVCVLCVCVLAFVRTCVCVPTRAVSSQLPFAHGTSTAA